MQYAEDLLPIFQQPYIEIITYSLLKCQTGHNPLFIR